MAAAYVQQSEMRDLKEQLPRFGIRLARPSDIPLLERVERSAAEAFRSVNLDFLVDGPTMEPAILSGMAKSNHLWIAVNDWDQPVGFLGGENLDGKFHLVEVSVAQGFQGRGIGKALIATMIEQVQREGYKAIALTTYRDVPWNGPRKGLLERLDINRDLGSSGSKKSCGKCPWQWQLVEIILERVTIGSCNAAGQAIPSGIPELRHLGGYNFLAQSKACGQIATAMYGLYHPDYIRERWYIFIAYLIITWMCCGTVLFANRALPALNSIGLIFTLPGVVITILEHQTAARTLLKGFRILDETFLAIGAQMVIGFFTAFFYMIAIFYATTNLDDVLAAPYFPLTTIYAQATSSTAGTMDLLFIIFVPILLCCIGTFITAGRCLWTLARDDAVPFSNTFRVISPRFKNPFNAAVICGIFSTVLGAIYVGSSTAFNAFVGSFVVLSTLSYLAAILPFMFTRRSSRSSLPPGPYIDSMKPGPYQL
ncbi:hypothetical protein G7Y89_g1477 [Cudoniella acicularis]|uniref:N-acetyltransferase domain-containing protein n=1 Tax=Cudoniella acicularis TaxID=354080 RepID=A0A8H4WA93_9HELO|nr:hypothetical protein G7Y89_g1477 [Cudoniella acicularis]